MRPRISENQSLRAAFRHAYRAKERGESRDERPFRAMRRIRQIGPLKPAAGFWPAFETLVWRLVPVSCTLVLVFAFLFMSMEQEADSGYFEAMAAEMEKPSLAELFDLEG
jgi:hypothetical protein